MYRNQSFLSFIFGAAGLSVGGTVGVASLAAKVAITTYALGFKAILCSSIVFSSGRTHPSKHSWLIMLTKVAKIDF